LPGDVIAPLRGEPPLTTKRLTSDATPPAPLVVRQAAIWSFSLKPAASLAEYVFSQIPQQVLAGDFATVIWADGLIPLISLSK
jgi:hypothetical protein